LDVAIAGVEIRVELPLPPDDLFDRRSATAAIL